MEKKERQRRAGATVGTSEDPTLAKPPNVVNGEPPIFSGGAAW